LNVVFPFKNIDLQLFFPLWKDQEQNKREIGYDEIFLKRLLSHLYKYKLNIFGALIKVGGKITSVCYSIGIEKKQSPIK
jgi:hypothetical protein